MNSLRTFCRFSLILLLLACTLPGQAQMVTRSDMVGYGQAFGLSPEQRATEYSVQVVQCSVPGNILWPKEQPTVTFQVTNKTDHPLQVRGKVDVIEYGTKGAPGDVWTPHVFKIANLPSVPITVSAPVNGVAEITIKPKLAARFGGYALVIDLGAIGRQFLTTFARTFSVSSQRVQYPHFCLDELPLPVLKRLGVHAIRSGESYKPTTDKDFPEWYAQEGKRYQELADNNITVLFMVGAGDSNGPTQPLGRVRPWLDDNGTMLDTKSDYAWLPKYDPDFQKFCYLFARDYGWPRGPITGFSLWNEPWEGISISGWGADMLRYRAMYTQMFQGVAHARKDADAQVLVGGGDSSSNALDKLFPDGKQTFAPMYDFLSIHYQGLTSTANFKQWINRKGYGGRVKIWDTESWVANTDDRVAAVVAGDRAAGYDRAMGIFGGNIADEDDFARHLPDGTTKQGKTVEAWSTAAAVGAATHFIGERSFRKLLFQNGLPWVMVFDGLNKNPEDGTVVIVGDLGEEFGANYMPFRTARGYAELAHKNHLKKLLAALPPDDMPSTKLASATDTPQPPTPRQKLETEIATPETLSSATMTINDNGAFRLYDFYGNPVPAQNGHINVPLDGRGFFLRSTGAPGSFAKLLTAIHSAHIVGIEPLATVTHDMTAPIGMHPTMHLTLTNILNRPVQGTLHIKLGGLAVKAPTHLSFGPQQTKNVIVQIMGGVASANNTYPLSLNFDAGADGKVVFHEDMHVNQIARRTITVDGDLNDWKGVLPQTIIASGTSAPTLTEKAWLPFKSFDTGTKDGFATGYLAYDKNFFYFAAKVADSTPDPGMVRFETRDDDAYFYPDVSYAAAGSQQSFSVRWSGQVQPRYSETYNFSTMSDDGVRLWVNGKQIIDDWNPHGPTEDVGSVVLQAGQKYDIKMEYYQGGGGADAQLFWQSKSQAKEVVPQDALFPMTGTSNGLTAQYYSSTDLTDLKTTRIDPTVDFTWTEGQYPTPDFGKSTLQALTWPAGVRHYSYRKDPDLPAGNAPNHDNIQIGFNVLPQSEKPYNLTVPGTMPGFVTTQDTDYEYALNPVAAAYGGGTEIWRLQAPGMSRKHFYPRQPKSPQDGPVKGGKLVMTHDGRTRIVECAIPWSEMPEVKKRINAGQTIKFSFRVNDNAGGPTMELSKDRSVSKRNGSFHEDWVEHWANTLEFGVEK